MSEPRTCAICGCTEHRACVDELRGACWWISERLCSHCATPDMRRARALVAASQLSEVVAELLRFFREGDQEAFSPFALDPAENTAEALRTILQIEAMPGGLAGNPDDPADRLPGAQSDEANKLLGAIERYIEGWA